MIDIKITESSFLNAETNTVSVPDEVVNKILQDFSEKNALYLEDKTTELAISIFEFGFETGIRISKLLRKAAV